MIGTCVARVDKVPEGPTNLEKFIDKGEMPQAVINTWIDIWQRDTELKRSYLYDYEIYDTDCNKGENSQVEVYLSIKNQNTVVYN